MPIEFRCTQCNKLLRTADASAGKKAKCPDCGWKLGHGWHRRELPAEVVEWAESFGAQEDAA